MVITRRWAADMDAKLLYDTANQLFSKKMPLNTLHQEIAENFYPERADFTIRRSMGMDFAANLLTSYPAMCRRDLGNQFGTMLRPTAKSWFHPGIKYAKTLDNNTKQYLEWFEEVQRRAMYDQRSQFTRATKEGDHDFAAFGQCAISVELNKMADGLLYRAWHIRDMAWQEGQDGTINAKFRKWKPDLQTLKQTFKHANLHSDILEKAKKEPFSENEVMHMVVEADLYDGDAAGRPYFSIWWDVDHQCVIEETPIWTGHYVIPRWQTVSNSQYSYSPATTLALPDGRLLQAMTYTLLEAGEKATSPPLIATMDAVRSDVANYAGGITWVDMEYDERLGDALRPLNQDFRGFNYGIELNQRTEEKLHKYFYLDSLNMPDRDPQMTAFEVGQRVQEYIRNALPIFEPMEMEYNAALCEITFDLLWRNGAFGNVASWPKLLQGIATLGGGTQVEFHFESPLHDAIEQQKGQKFQEAQGLISIAVSLDPSCSLVPKAEVALRDALTGIGVPATWMNTEAFVKEGKAAQAAQAQQSQKLNMLEQGSNVVKNIGQAGIGTPGATQDGTPAGAAQ